MFTGIIQDVGRIAVLRRQHDITHLSIETKLADQSLHVGDSISISGVCLTATNVSVNSRLVNVSAVQETLKRSSLSGLTQGSRVNLELALRPSDRLGGHFVQGHVDSVGRCDHISRLSNSWEMTFTFPEEFAELVVDKGSIAIDGVSLTVYDCTGRDFKVSIIPHTLASTTLKDLSIGAMVNLEFDIIGKYVQRIMQREQSAGLTIQKLKDYGY